MSVRPALVALLASACALSACTTVGPDYAAPEAIAAPTAFARAPDATAAAAQEPEWWRGYQDPQLDKLVGQALAANLDLAAAQARLRQARAALRRERAERTPSGGAEAGYARQRVALAAYGFDLPGVKSGTLDLYRTEFDASWELDLFGGERRRVEAAHAVIAAAAARAADARVSLAAEVVSTYVDLRGGQARLALAQQILDTARRRHALIQVRLGQGAASVDDLDKAAADLDALVAADTTLRARIDADLDALAVLSGQAPGALDEELGAPGVPLAPPAGLAVGDPASLLRRRPDVRAAERDLAADTARIGVAMADLFPKVSLSGGYGYSAVDPAKLGTASALGFHVGPTLSWNFLELNRVRADVVRTQARRDESLAIYQGKVLNALQDAETGLSRLRNQQAQVENLRRVKAAADRSLDITRLRLREGAASQFDALEAEQRRLSAQEQLVDAQTQLAMDYAALSKSLGFGWAGEATS